MLAVELAFRNMQLHVGKCDWTPQAANAALSMWVALAQDESAKSTRKKKDAKTSERKKWQ